MNERLIYLFDAYKNKSASAQEIEELLHLLNSENEESIDLLYREYLEQFNNEDFFFSSTTSEKILNNILNHSIEASVPLYSYKKYLVAAVLLVAFGVGLIFMFTKMKSSDLEIERLASNGKGKIVAGGNKATLTLSDGSIIVLDNAKNGLLREQKNTIIKKTASGQLVFEVKDAAPNQNAALLNTIETPKGGQYQVILPDQTKAWLNAASSIQFPSGFTGKQRKVKITGEVYFEVAKNAAMPFIVESKNSTIEVLGTHFNVMDYEDENISRTTLLEGSVKIFNRDVVEILKPGQQALYGENSALKLETLQDPFKEIGWKSGFFVFKDTSIDMVMREIARWYDVKVVFERPVGHNEFTGKISRNIPLDELLKILSYAGFNFKVDGKNLIVLSQ